MEDRGHTESHGEYFGEARLSVAVSVVKFVLAGGVVRRIEASY